MAEERRFGGGAAQLREVLTELGYCLLHTPDASKAEQPVASALSEKN